jgi:hypothetical protein
VVGAAVTAKMAPIMGSRRSLRGAPARMTDL